MLNDPLILPSVELTRPEVVAATAQYSVPNGTPVEFGLVQSQFRTIDLAPGKSVRKAVPEDRPEHKLQMTISHTVSKENAPYATLRSVVRLDDSFVDVNGRPVTTSAFFVVSSPQGITTVNAPSQVLLSTLAKLVLFGTRKSQNAPQNAANSDPFIGRFLTGEP